MNKSLNQLELNLKYSFKDKSLIDLALVHKSAFHESKNTLKGHNEKLEFLGDAVLDLVLSEILMSRFPEDSEGNLSKKRASLVNEDSLALIAGELKLSEFIVLGKGEQLTGGDKKPRLLASVYEAVMGALFLDAGFDKAKETATMHFEKLLSAIDPTRDFTSDFKTRLQEVIQAEKKPAPVYKLKSEVGPSHEKSFEVEVYVNEHLVAAGVGKSKKQAEQEAAKMALVILANQGRINGI